MARRRDDGPRRPSPARRGLGHDRPHGSARSDDRAREAIERGGRSAHPDDSLVRIAGLPSVAELFEAGAERVERLYFEADLRARVQPWCAVLARRRKVYRQVGADEMRRVAGTAMHGGIVALARPRPIRELDLDAAASWAAAGDPLLVLDGVGNPQNIGAIVRTAAFFGVRRIVMSDHPGQSGLSDTAYRIAKGGLEHTELYRTRDLPAALRRLAGAYHVVGTAAARGTPLARIGRSAKPVALVLGNEEDGLPPQTLAACTTVAVLKGSGLVQSLNVSAAAAVLIQALMAPP